MAYKRISPIPVVEGGSGAQTLTGVLTGNATSAFTANAVTQFGTVIAGASNAVSSVAPSATSGVPYISQGAASNPTFGTAVVAGGGTGVATLTAYAVICGGTTATGAVQSIASVGTSGQILTSNGAGALPTFQAPAGTSTLTYTLVNSSPYVVLSTDEFLGVDCSGGAIQVNLPNAPATGRTYVIKDITGNAQTNNITVTTVGGVVLVDASATYVMNTQYQSINVLFNGTKYLVY